jgi:ACS family tartrate transporter-like MFS transporter
MSTSPPTALDRARSKAYIRLLPLLFFCYVIAYIDRGNVAIAFKTMRHDLPGFDDDVLGTGFGIFFLGYFLLEIPGTLLVEKWSASKWISRIMISWGIVAGLTAIVKTPWQFYSFRFILGLAEAGFFPGVIVYLTHWFPSRDRSRALSWFLIGTPVAQAASPFLSYPILKIGTDQVVNGQTVHIPALLGLQGWQWVYITWGIPAVVLGLLVLFFLTDRPRQANWLTPEEREALESELERERSMTRGKGHMTWLEAFKNPKVLVLAAAYFFIVTGNYGIESFLPTILGDKNWYGQTEDQLQYLLIIPAAASLIGQRLVGWSSDWTKERRLHAALPIYLGAAALACTLLHHYPLAVMMLFFALAAAGLKAYLPAFWALPSLFLTEAAAASSIGFINSIGNLGGFVGSKVMGYVAKQTGSYTPGITILCISITISATIIILLGLGKQSGAGKPKPAAEPDPLAEALIEPS